MHDLLKFDNPSLSKPTWNPFLMEDNSIPQVTQIHLSKLNYPIYFARNVLEQKNLNRLIHQFDNQQAYPVGVDGYVDEDSKPGSYRAMAWSESLTRIISEKLEKIITEKDFVKCSEYELLNNFSFYTFKTPFKAQHRYKLLGSTPWMRFMKYKNKGMHTPHHDAPYENTDEKYTTLFSWVLYLNTPDGEGGSFDFIDDGQTDNHPKDWNLSDWKYMSSNYLDRILPQAGSMLIFPHWLCHQVDEYIGKGYRYIIRGDVAYGY